MNRHLSPQRQFLVFWNVRNMPLSHFSSAGVARTVGCCCPQDRTLRVSFLIRFFMEVPAKRLKAVMNLS